MGIKFEKDMLPTPKRERESTTLPKMAVARPGWRRDPFNAPPRNRKKMYENLSDYFIERYDSGEHPQITDMAGEAGFDSVTQMLNHARRNPTDMKGIARGILAVSAGYEEQAQTGNRNALALLALMPEFDSEEPADQAPQRPFMPQRELNVNVTGVARRIDQGALLSEQEAYLTLIKNKTYEEITAAVLETERTDTGDYAVLDIGIDNE